MISGLCQPRHPTTLLLVCIAIVTAAVSSTPAAGAIGLPSGPVHVVLEQGNKTLVDATAAIPPGYAFDGLQAIDLAVTTPAGNSNVILKIHIPSPGEDFTSVHFYLRSVDDLGDPDDIGTDGLLDASDPLDSGPIRFTVDGLNFFPNVVASYLANIDTAAAFYMLLPYGPAGSFVKLPGGKGFGTGIPGQSMWQVPMSKFLDADPLQYVFTGLINFTPMEDWAVVPNPIDAGFGLVDVATGLDGPDPDDGKHVVEIGAAAFLEVIPEPATVLLLGLAVVTVAMRRRRSA